MPLNRKDRLRAAALMEAAKKEVEGRHTFRFPIEDTLWLALKVEELDKEILKLRANRHTSREDDMERNL